MWLVDTSGLDVEVTFQMCFKCNWWIHWGKSDPEPAIYPRCSHWFPGHLAPSVHQGIQLDLEGGRIFVQNVNPPFQHLNPLIVPKNRCPHLLLEILHLTRTLVDTLMDIVDGLIKILVTFQVRLHKFINELAKIMNFALKTIALERGLVT